MKAKVFVRLKEGVLDPQGAAVRNALEALGYRGVRDVRVGKLIELDLEVGAGRDAPSLVEEMCARLLANPVIEDYAFEVAGEGE